MPPADAQVIGGYAVIKALGDESDALFLARHVKAARVVTLKQLTLPEPADPQGLVDLVARARAAPRLKDPQLLEIYDFVEQAGRWYAVLEPLFGESLRTRARRGPLTIAAAVGVVTQAAEALALLHRAGRGHGAITPASLFLVDRERVQDFVKVLDFGAGSGEDEMVPFTSLAPERRSSEPPTARFDVWGLGAVLFELLEGRTPHEARQLSANARTGEPIPPLLAELVSRCLQNDPRERFSSVESMAASILHAMGLADKPVPSAASYRALPPVGGQRRSSGASHPALSPVGGERRSSQSSLSPVGAARRQPSSPSNPALPQVGQSRTSHAALAPVTTLQQFPVVVLPPTPVASPEPAPGALPRRASRRWLALLALPLLAAPGAWWAWQSNLVAARPEAVRLPPSVVFPPPELVAPAVPAEPAVPVEPVEPAVPPVSTAPEIERLLLAATGTKLAGGAVRGAPSKLRLKPPKNKAVKKKSK